MPEALVLSPALLRETLYGAREIRVRDPAGNVLPFAPFAAEEH